MDMWNNMFSCLLASNKATSVFQDKFFNGNISVRWKKNVDKKNNNQVGSKCASISFYRWCFSRTLHWLRLLYIRVIIIRSHTHVRNLYLVLDRRICPSLHLAFFFLFFFFFPSPVELESATNLHVQIELANGRFVCWIVRSRSGSRSFLSHFLLLLQQPPPSASGNRGYF